jgi:hypothetical protein
MEIPDYFKSFEGTLQLGDGGPAASALLYLPYAAIVDAAGNPSKRSTR